jgi:hypothetical protein
VRRLLFTASVVPSSLSLVTLMKEALSSPPKRRFLHEPHGVTYQKTAFFKGHRVCFFLCISPQHLLNVFELAESRILPEFDRSYRYRSHNVHRNRHSIREGPNRAISWHRVFEACACVLKMPLASGKQRERRTGGPHLVADVG